MLALFPLSCRRCFKGRAVALGGVSRSVAYALSNFEIMGCSSSSPAATVGSNHNFDLAAAADILSPKEKEPQDPTSSWEIQDIPKGYPTNKLLPPDRKLHEKHVRKLTKYLKEVEEKPTKLLDGVDKKRLASNLLCSSPTITL